MQLVLRNSKVKRIKKGREEERDRGTERGKNGIAVILK